MIKPRSRFPVPVPVSQNLHSSLPSKLPALRSTSNPKFQLAPNCPLTPDSKNGSKDDSISINCSIDSSKDDSNTKSNNNILNLNKCFTNNNNNNNNNNNGLMVNNSNNCDKRKNFTSSGVNSIEKYKIFVAKSDIDGTINKTVTFDSYDGNNETNRKTGVKTDLNNNNSNKSKSVFNSNNNNNINSINDNKNKNNKAVDIGEKEIILSKNFEKDRPNDFEKLFIEKCREVSKKVTSQENTQKKIALFDHLFSCFQFPTLIRKLTQPCLDSVITVFSTNIFGRVLPKIGSCSFPPSIYFLFDRYENYYDKQWPLLSLSYQLLEGVLKSSHVSQNLLNSTFSSDFIIKLFQNSFASPDNRERQQGKNILYAIAGRIPDRGNLIFLLIKNFINDTINNNEPSTWGAPQILELFSSMTQSIPLFTANSFDGLLVSHILPLFLSNDYTSFEAPLDNLMNKVLLQRNPRNSNHVIVFLLNHFPIRNQKKQLSFLKEIFGVVKNYWQTFTPPTAQLLFTRLSKLFNDECAEIAETSLSMIYQEGFPQLLEMYFQALVPMMYFRAKSVSDSYWCEPVTFLALAMIQEMSRIDVVAFGKISSNLDYHADKIRERREDRRKVWDLLQKQNIFTSPVSSALSSSSNGSNNTNINSNSNININNDNNNNSIFCCTGGDNDNDNTSQNNHNSNNGEMASTTRCGNLMMVMPNKKRKIGGSVGRCTIAAAATTMNSSTTAGEHFNMPRALTSSQPELIPLKRKREPRESQQQLATTLKNSKAIMRARRSSLVVVAKK